MCATFDGNFRKTGKSGKNTPEQQVSYLTLPFQTTGSPESLNGRMVGLAQLAERLVVVQEVAGSTPVAHPHEGWQLMPSLPQRLHRISGAAFVGFDGSTNCRPLPPTAGRRTPGRHPALHQKEPPT
jgi:hypothetical protein